LRGETGGVLCAGQFPQDKRFAAQRAATCAPARDWTALSAQYSIE
jgi:hypothetical protein